MKKVVLFVSLLAIVMLFALPVSAQQMVGLADKGIKVGVNMATFGGDDVDDVDSRTGLVAGAYAKFKFTPLLSIQPELLFSMKGAEYGDNTAKLNYIEIPVLIQASFPSPNFVPNFYVGPALGIKLSETLEYDGEEVETDDDAYKGTDFGLAVGLGAKFTMISVEARYTLGLSSIDDSGFDADIKNQVLSIMAGYSF